MKILHIIPDLQIAGAQSLVVNILKYIDRKLFDICLCVLYPSYNTKLDLELLKEKIPVYYLGKHRGIDIRMISRLNRILNNFKPDIIHTHMYITRYPLIPTLVNRIPIRVHTLHTLAQQEVDFAGQIIQWLAFNFFNIIPISVSDNVAASVRKVYGVSSVTIYNGVPVERFIPIKTSTGDKKEETVFINISGFRPEKNHRLLINAFTRVSKIKKGIKLFLVGDGPLRSDIEKLVKEKKLQNKITFFGVRSDILKLLEKSDVLVLSSKREGFGLTIVEAMAAGKAVIATAVDGVPELIETGITGVLVPPNDPSALAAAMIKLADDPGLRIKMGEKGRKQAIKQFNITNTVRNYENFYMSLYKKRYKC